MVKHKISVQFGGSNQDRLSDEIDGVKIYPKERGFTIQGKKIKTGNFFKDVNPDNPNNQVFSIGGPGGWGVSTSPRARAEQKILPELEKAKKK